MKKLLKTILVGALLCLQGCMTYWANPGGRNWETDLRTCTAQSTKNVCRATNQVSNSVCRRSPMGDYRCQEVTTPSQTICEPEENTQLQEACLQGIGWRKVSEADRDSPAVATYREFNRQLDLERAQSVARASQWQNYIDQWHNCIKQNLAPQWANPPARANGSNNPTMRYKVTIDRTAKLTGVTLDDSSGIAEFDTAVGNAIRSCSPSPIPSHVPLPMDLTLRRQLYQ